MSLFNRALSFLPTDRVASLKPLTVGKEKGRDYGRRENKLILLSWVVQLEE